MHKSWLRSWSISKKRWNDWPVVFLFSDQRHTTFVPKGVVPRQQWALVHCQRFWLETSPITHSIFLWCPLHRTHFFFFPSNNLSLCCPPNSPRSCRPCLVWAGQEEEKRKWGSDIWHQAITRQYRGGCIWETEQPKTSVLLDNDALDAWDRVGSHETNL